MFCKLSISGTTFLKLPYDLFFMTKYCVDKLNLLTIHKKSIDYTYFFYQNPHMLF
jgi:hypothetical protein